MTTMLLEMYDKFYIINCPTYNLTTKRYENGTEKLEIWIKLFSCPPESTNVAAIESFIMNAPPNRTVIVFQTNQSTYVTTRTNSV